jgi:DNA repair protein RecN (Recombination protein N)
MEALFVEFKDLVFDLQNKAEKIEISPELISQISERINLVNNLFQKHRLNNTAELLELRDKLETEQSNFDHLSEAILQKEKSLLICEKQLLDLSHQLAENRDKTVPVFKKSMESLLQKLGLEKAKIEVDLQPSTAYNLFGKQNISILFQANAGFALKPIQTAISGGERSRVMLAVKKIMAENMELPTLILDEIDTGVSGKVADEMGRLMQEMAKNLQLIVISHLAQVAAKGNNNYKVVKSEVNGKTQSTIVTLDAEEKLQEIAQLLSGSKITDAALQQAKELMS